VDRKIKRRGTTNEMSDVQGSNNEMKRRRMGGGGGEGTSKNLLTHFGGRGPAFKKEEEGTRVGVDGPKRRGEGGRGERDGEGV